MKRSMIEWPQSVKIESKQLQRERWGVLVRACDMIGVSSAYVREMVERNQGLIGKRQLSISESPEGQIILIAVD